MGLAARPPSPSDVTAVAAGINRRSPAAVNGETLLIREIPHVWPVLYFPGERSFPVNR